MPRSARSNSTARQERRHNPLSEDYSPTEPLKLKAGKKRKQSNSEAHEQNGYVESKASRRILDLGRDLAAEDEAARQHSRPPPDNSAFSFESRFPTDVVSDDDGGAEVGDYDDEQAWGSEDEEVEEVEIDPADLETFNRFHPTFDPATLLQPKMDETDTPQQPSTNLADLILEKIAAHEAIQQQPSVSAAPHLPVLGGGDPSDAIQLPAKVVDVYTQIAHLLSRYKSGKLPKPFKILPTLPQCQILLSITRPETWTPNAVYEASKLFISSRPALAQAFCADILLPRVRDDIHETRKLNVHLYKALKKALYKPAAFFRGFLFPLAASGTCTLREAHIVASVLARVSIPVLHSAAALYRLCELAAEQMFRDADAAGACNIFIRTLLEKRYALPYRVVDALVFHFLRFRAVAARHGGEDDDGDGDVAMQGHHYGHGRGGLIGRKGAAEGDKLPVLWHQCLLAFAQRYKNEITEDQREALLDLVAVRGHRQIGPEVRRELLEGRARGATVDAGSGGPMDGGDDTMINV